MDSILNSIKKLLGIQEDYDVFDIDLIIHINTVLSILSQIGVIPLSGFSIGGKEDKWEDIGIDKDNFEMVKSYVYLKVRLLFDPPQGSMIDVINRQISEIEWRMYTNSDMKEDLDV